MVLLIKVQKDLLFSFLSRHIFSTTADLGINAFIPFLSLDSLSFIETRTKNAMFSQKGHAKWHIWYKVIIVLNRSVVDKIFGEFIQNIFHKSVRIISRL